MSLPPEIDLACRDLVERVTDYLDGDLPPTQQQAVEQHLLLCAGCQRYLAQIRETAALSAELRHASRTTSAQSIQPDLLAAFRRRYGGPGGSSDPTSGDV